MRKVFMFLVLILVFVASCGETPLTPDPDPKPDPNPESKPAYTLEQFNKAGTFDSGSVDNYELSSTGWTIATKPEGVWVGLFKATAVTPNLPAAGDKVMKLDYYDKTAATQISTHGFSMNTKVTIPTAGNYTVRFKYRGKNFGGDIKVAFDDVGKVIPTENADSSDANWVWNSADGSGGYESYVSQVDFALDAKDYTFTLSIDGTYNVGEEWGFIDGIEIVKKP